MAAPRQIIPGRFYLITRRCSQRMFLLRPDARTNQTFLFCILVAARRSGVQIVAFTALSNHYHLVLYDPAGHVTDFIEHAHKLAARSLNARWGRWENFWSNEPTSLVHLVTPNDVLRAVLYTLANPVAAHLVATVGDWPGVSSFSAMLSGKALTANRPNEFFRRQGPLPSQISSLLLRPPGFEDLSQEEWKQFLLARLHAREEKARAERQASGRRIRGRKALRSESAFESPTTPARHRTLRPELACKDPFLRKAHLLALRIFRRTYAHALSLLRDGNVHVVFPFGTLRMKRLGLRCAVP